MFSKFINRLRGAGFTTVNQIKSNLRSQHKVASGNLIAGTRFAIDVNTSLISMKFFAPKQWEFVDQGRQPGGKFPPKRAILKWLRQKGLDPRLEYPIRRKIARDGIKATNIYTDAVKDFKKNFKVQTAIGEDIQKQVSNVLNNR